MTISRLFLAVAASIMGMLFGCHPTGPASIRAGRADYNIAVQQTNDQQLLLNLVRLKYRDTPFFLETASIATSFTFEASGSSSAALLPSQADTFGLGGKLAYTEKPTITYLPLRGEKFVTQLLSPVELQTLLLLYHSGWSMDRLMRVIVQEINGIPNAPTASGPTPTQAPKYKRFRRVTALMRELQLDRILTLGAAGEGDDARIEIRIAPEAQADGRVQRLIRELNLDPAESRFTLTRAIAGGGGDQIALVTRSLMASLFYLSQGVEVPARDRSAGRVTVTRDASGEVFDWKSITGDLLRVRSSGPRPVRAYTTVRYRGAWFYIDDSDLDSKSTFSLLTQLLALQSGEIKPQIPLLTLPVSR